MRCRLQRVRHTTGMHGDRDEYPPQGARAARSANASMESVYVAGSVSPPAALVIVLVAWASTVLCSFSIRYDPVATPRLSDEITFMQIASKNHFKGKNNTLARSALHFGRITSLVEVARPDPRHKRSVLYSQCDSSLVNNYELIT